MHAYKSIKQILTDLKGEKDSNTKIVEDFNTPLLSMGGLSKQKIKKEALDLNDTLDLYRPISLIKIDVKILNKIFTN